MFNNKPKFLLYALLLLFFLPIIGAWYLLNYHSGILHNTTNRGTLLQPMLKIENLPFSDYNIEDSINAKQWHGKWVMMYIKGNNCDQRCLTTIYLMGQTRVALNKYQNKVLTAYTAVNANVTTNPSSEILRQYPRTLLFKTSALNLTNFLNQTSLTHLVLQQGAVFLIDPNGYVMMRYPSDVDFEDVYQDLDHLLKLGPEA